MFAGVDSKLASLYLRHGRTESFDGEEEKSKKLTYLSKVALFDGNITVCFVLAQMYKVSLAYHIILGKWIYQQGLGPFSKGDSLETGSPSFLITFKMGITFKGNNLLPFGSRFFPLKCSNPVMRDIKCLG